MPIYEKTTKELMTEWAISNLKPGDTFVKSDVINWFKEKYPKIRPNTVSMHVEGFATNNARHRSHHPHIRANNGWDLFFKIDSGKFRLYDEQADPAPLYDVEDSSSLSSVSQRQEQLETPEGEVDEYDTQEFAYEKDLQNFLTKNLHLIEDGLSLFEDEGFVGVEYSAGGGRRIDILANDKNGDFVVIELKATRAYDRVAGQLARYVAWVRENMAEGRKVRGIVIAPEISHDLQLACSLIPNVSLMEYSLRFDLKKVSHSSARE